MKFASNSSSTESQNLLSHEHMSDNKSDAGHTSDKKYTTSKDDRDNNASDPDEYKLYTKRWWVLAMFCLSNFANALLWVTFAPISDVTQRYFGGSSSPVGNLFAINMLAIVWQALYGPGTLYGVYLMKKHDLRYTMLIAGIVTFIGTLIRIIAAAAKDSLGNTGAYSLMFVGQCVGSLVQPIYVNMPAAIASIWFSKQERDMSTTIGSMFSPLGNALGTILPVIFVYETTNDNGDNVVHGMTNLMLVEAAFCLAPAIIIYFYFDSEPKTAPSKSTQAKRVMKHSETASQRDSIGLSRIRKEFHELLSNTNYVLLLISFSVGLGVFTTIMTLINEIVALYGYSNDDAGTFGASMIVCGLVGAGLMGYLMERTRWYRSLLKLGFGLGTLGMVVLACVLKENNFNVVLFSFSLLGFCILPMLPAVLENCAETTYPVAEELSAGLLFVGGNYVGIVFIFAVQVTLHDDSLDGHSYILTPMKVLMVSFVVISFIILLFYNGHYKRMECENCRIVSSSFSVKDNQRTISKVGKVSTGLNPANNSDPETPTGNENDYLNSSNNSNNTDDSMLALISPVGNDGFHTGHASDTSSLTKSYLIEPSSDMRPSQLFIREDFHS